MLLRRTGASLVLIAAMGLLTSACHFNNWYGYRGYNDGGANNVDSHNLTAAQASPLTEAGEAPIGSLTLPALAGAADFQTGPIEVDGTLFVNGNDGYLHAFAETDGKDADTYLDNPWNGKTSGTVGVGSPPPSAVTAGDPHIGRLILAPSAQSNVVYAYRTDGTLQWSADLGAQGGAIGLWSSAVDDSRQGVTVIGAGNYVFTLNTDTGAILSRSTKFAEITTPVIGGFVPVPGGTGEFVWFGTTTGHVKGLDDANLGEVWDFADGSATAMGAITADTSGHVIAGIAGGNLIGLDEATGGREWTGTLGSGSPNCACGSGALAVSGSAVYMVTSDGHIRSFDTSTGVANLGSTTTTGPASITIANGVVYGSDPVVTYGASDLAKLAKQPSLSFGATVWTEAVPADGAVWIVGTDGYLHELT
jgi:outer membrane protein assembly factor BamB